MWGRCAGPQRRNRGILQLLYQLPQIQRSIYGNKSIPPERLRSRSIRSLFYVSRWDAVSPRQSFALVQRFRYFSLQAESRGYARRKGSEKPSETPFRKLLKEDCATVTVIKSAPVVLEQRGPKAKLSNTQPPKQSPLETLKNHYQKKHKYLGASFKVNFQNSVISFVDDNARCFQVWHSVFTCPVSRTTFPCGKVIDSTTVLPQVPPGGTEGYFYYPKRKEAEQAAAARALDALGVSSPPLCVYDDADPLIPAVLDARPAPALEKKASVAINEKSKAPSSSSATKRANSESSTAGKANVPHQEDKELASTSSVAETKELCDPVVFYNREFQMHISNDNYESELVQRAGVSGWTSVFTCPLSGTQYPSGTVATLEVLSIHGDKDDTRILYRSKRDAELAAGMWAVDVVRYQTMGIRVPRHCQEDPAQIFGHGSPTAEETVAPFLSEGVKSSSTSAKGIKDVKSSIDKSQSDKKMAPAPTSSKNKKLTSSTEQRKDHLSVSMGKVSVDPHKESGKRPSGLLANFLSAIDSSAENGMNGASPFDKIDSADDQRLGGSDNAVHPINESSDKEDGVVSVLPTTFGASPLYQIPTGSSSVISPTELIYVDDEENGVASNLPSTFDASPASPTELTFLDDMEDGAPSTFAASPAGQLFEVSSEIIGRWDDTSSDDENDGVVAVIPSVIGVSPAHRLLAESFKDVKSAGLESGQLRHGAVPKRMDVVLHVAEAWLASNPPSADVSDSPHRLTLPKRDTGKRLFLANTILSALAKVAQATPIGTSTHIEAVAKKILDSLWKSKDSFPDADSYTCFLKCVGGANSVITLEIAEAIVDAMRRGAKHKTNAALLPKPNQGTLNCLIQITAQIGGESGRYPKHIDSDVDFTPDRESFLSILSSCIYSPAMELEYGGFDRAFVEECIERMSQMAAQSGSDSLLPDTAVYNAPLRWTGGPVLWMESRPYARYVNWDNYEQLYATKGKVLRKDLDENHHSVEQARAMEVWLQTMETVSATNSRVSPNVETYEAVIQAWLRTSSREGLDRAQELLRKLLNSYDENDSLRPRLQTFHPVIASLYHAKLVDSASKILSWIEEWEKLSVNSESDFDTRVVEMKLATLLQAQSNLLGGGSNSKLPRDERRAEILTKANGCSEIVDATCQYLERLSALGRLESQPLDVEYFLKAVHAWENVAALGAEIKDPQLTSSAVSGMMHLFERFETAVRSCIRNTNGISLKEKELNAQLVHIVTASHVFFCRLVMQLGLLHETKDRSAIIPMLERMTRVVGECAEIEALCLYPEENSVHSNQPKIGMPKQFASSLARSQPDDLFEYHLQKDKMPNSSRFAFLWQVVKFLDEASTDDAAENLSDILRIIFLVKEICSSRQRSSKMIETTDKILRRLQRQVAVRRDCLVDEVELEQSPVISSKKVEVVSPKKIKPVPISSKVSRSAPPPKISQLAMSLPAKSTPKSMSLKKAKSTSGASTASMSGRTRKASSAKKAASKPMKVNGAL
jgi:hypothetical protein